MSRWQSGELRREINKHLHHMHDGYSAPGSTQDRIEAHERLHGEKECDHYHPVEEDPVAYEPISEGD